MSTETLVSNDSFSVLLRKFNKLTENMPPKDKIAPNLADIKNEAINDHELTGWQREAITARCDNYMNGTYGSTSKAHEVHQHVKTPK